MSILVHHIGVQGDVGMEILFGILLPWGRVLWSADMCDWVSKAICTDLYAKESECLQVAK